MLQKIGFMGAPPFWCGRGRSLIFSSTSYNDWNVQIAGMKYIRALGAPSVRPLG